ncbi:MAG: recombinase family protein [Rhizobiaceae bacterium]
MLVGYARTSTFDQTAGIEAQIRELVKIGTERVFSEQVSSVSSRPELDAALDFVREGDALVVTKLDRLARSTVHLLSIVEELENKGISLRVLDFGGTEVDTHSPTGKLTLTMFAAMAQFEREMMLERQREGIARAKLQGKYKGRKPTAMAKKSEVLEMRTKGIGATQIAAELGISRASVYRIISMGN